MKASSKHMKNFPDMNWALKLTHNDAVVLPYHAYLKHLEGHPEDEAKLDEIRVLIDEPALLPRFRYVSEQLHDDHALALLYKLCRALLRRNAPVQTGRGRDRDARGRSAPMDSIACI
jgi:exodeoxyribonuclease V alpha subunit